MTILDAGLIPPQPASVPIGFLDAPPYEEVVFLNIFLDTATIRKFCSIFFILLSLASRS